MSFSNNQNNTYNSISYIVRSAEADQRKSRFRANLERGFDLCARREQIRQDIARGGRGLMKGLIGAIIAKGINEPASISTEIAELGGDHLYLPAQDLLRECEGEDPELHPWRNDSLHGYVLNS